jgi:hypothetical protein
MSTPTEVATDAIANADPSKVAGAHDIAKRVVQALKAAWLLPHRDNRATCRALQIVTTAIILADPVHDATAAHIAEAVVRALNENRLLLTVGA